MVRAHAHLTLPFPMPLPTSAASSRQEVDGSTVRPRGTAPLRTSVILPVLNEEARVPAALERLAVDPEWHEIIVVDGGSADRSAALAAEFAGVRMITAPRGRASQLNAGAAAASGDVLLFLHVDVELPARASSLIRTALCRDDVVAGAFRTWTVVDAGRRPWWSPLIHLADMRSRYSRLPYGDQGLFVRTDVFRAVGGFPAIALMEDFELSRRLRRAGRVVTLPASVVVSGRRFVARPLFYLLVMNLFPLLYRIGVSPARLSRIYGHIR